MDEKEKLAYLGGIIDGEGTIAITKKKIAKRGYNPSYVLRVSIAGSDKQLSKWLKENFGGKIYALNMQNGFNKKKMFQWILNSNNGYKLLKKVKDYLLIKKEQADLAIEFYQDCVLKYNFKGRSTPIWLSQKREEYFIRLKEMHQ